jgi:alpha-aminoadipic semialdehyde synthase
MAEQSTKDVSGIAPTTCTTCTETSHAHTKKPNVIGIRAETKNVWERRAPLTPKHVAYLIKMGIPVCVETSTTRTFSDEQYRSVGAKIVKDLYAPEHDVSVVLGVKQIPVQRLPRDGKPRTYCFFSHTFKQQSANCGRFAAYADAKMTLVDYELIKTAPGGEVRAMKFGPYAGLGGAIDGLHSLGRLLLERGYATPFLYISPAWQYKNIEDAWYAIERVGREIRENGLPREVCPLVVMFTSNGDASTGAFKVFEHLPCKYVCPENLKDEFGLCTTETHRIVVTTATYTHMVERVDNQAFVKTAYKQATAETIAREYRPIFAERYMPYVSVIINCVYWESKYPRLVAADEVGNCKRLLLCVDVTCDPCGTLEFFVKDVQINKPFYTVRLRDFEVESREVKARGEDPTTHVWKCVHAGFPKKVDVDANPVLVYGVDHIPAETPIDASDFFGDHLLPYVRDHFAYHDTTAAYPFADLPQVINDAIELVHGNLTSKFSTEPKQAQYDLRQYLERGHSEEWAKKNAGDFD